MPAKRTMRFLAARSGTSLLCAARSWALVGFQGVGNVRFIGRSPFRVMMDAPSSYHWPKCAPPSTYRMSPVTWGKLRAGKMAKQGAPGRGCLSEFSPGSVVKEHHVLLYGLAADV